MNVINSIGVVGAGFMGSGIAESAAGAGLAVVLHEPDDAPLERSRERVAESVARTVSRSKLAEAEAVDLQRRITWITEVDDAGDSQLVIEAVTQDPRVKAKVFARLDALMPLEVILASNASSIPIAELAAHSDVPDRVLGLHFFVPMPVMKLVEVVVALETSEKVVERVEAFAAQIGKSAIRTKDRSGLVPYLMAAVRMYAEGFASREDIDEGMKLGCEHPMGPLALCDLIGLDVLYSVCHPPYEEFERDEYTQPPLMKRMVASGHLGRKTGRGFCEHPSPSETAATSRRDLAVDAGSIKGLVKAEIHTHLEALSRRAIEDLARDAGEHPPPPGYAPRGLAELLEYVDWSCDLVRTGEHATRIGREFAERAGASGVRHVDAILNPRHWGRWRARLADLLEALAVGFEEAETRGGPGVNVCLSLLRDQSGDEALELVEWMGEVRPPRVVALSIDGDERATGRVSARFADAFARARQLGFSLTAHAGESSGAEGVWDAIDLLGVDRIDHGFRAISDRKLVETLAERRIPLGICPSANVQLGWVTSIPDHPVERLRQAGVRVSINTDSSWDFDLVEEYRLCAEAFQWDDAVVRQLAAASIEASFASAAEKQAMLAELR